MWQKSENQKGLSRILSSMIARRKIFFLLLSSALLIFVLLPHALASNYRNFLVEKVFGDRLLINDGYSQYIIEYNYDCYSSDFLEGSYIYIDSYLSPIWGDTIITEGFYGKETCEVTNSEEVNLKKYLVVSVIDNKDEIIVEDKRETMYLVEYGIGCGLSMWRYEGKYIDINVGGGILNGISDRVYLFDSDNDCKVWDAEEISSGHWDEDYEESYNVNLCDFIDCPLNSSCSNGQCFCNTGYILSDNSCITYTQNCQNQYGSFSDGDKDYCYCKSSYEWNSSKTKCIKSITCPSNSLRIENICVCKDGYVMRNGVCISYTEDCIREFGQNVYGTKGEDNNSSCHCKSDYEWNSARTGCIKSIVCSTNSIKVGSECVCDVDYEWNLYGTDCTRIVEVLDREISKDEEVVKLNGGKEDTEPIKEDSSKYELTSERVNINKQDAQGGEEQNRKGLLSSIFLFSIDVLNAFRTFFIRTLDKLSKVF